jgi:hypothetical protein
MGLASSGVNGFSIRDWRRGSYGLSGSLGPSQSVISMSCCFSGLLLVVEDSRSLCAMGQSAVLFSGRCSHHAIIVTIGYVSMT